MKKSIAVLLLLIIPFILAAEDQIYEAETISHFEQGSPEEGLFFETESNIADGGKTFLLTFIDEQKILILDTMHNVFVEYDLDEGFVGRYEIDSNIAIFGNVMSFNNDRIIEIIRMPYPSYYRFNENYELIIDCELTHLGGDFGVNYDSMVNAFCYTNNSVFFWMKNGSFLSIENPGPSYEENNNRILDSEETRALFNAGTVFSSKGYELVGDDFLLLNGELLTDSYNHLVTYHEYLVQRYAYRTEHQYGIFSETTSFHFIGLDVDGNTYYNSGNRFLIFDSDSFCIERFSVEHENYYSSSAFIDDSGNIYWMEYTPYTEGTGELTRGPSNSRAEIVGADYYIKKISRQWGLPEPSQSLGE